MSTPAFPSPAPGAPPPGVTELLAAWSGGDARALDALLPAVYDELRRQAARALRRVLVDPARGRPAAKRGGGARPVTLGGAGAASGPAAGAPAVDVLALDDALARPSALDPQQGRVVRLRYFGGLDTEETAAALGVSPATVERERAVARAWLRRELAA